MRPSVDEFLLGWGTVGDIADVGVLVGVVMWSRWDRKGCIDSPIKLLYESINIINQSIHNNGRKE